MRKIIGVVALAGLAACSVDHNSFAYEITERSPDRVSVQTHAGMLNLSPKEVGDAQLLMHEMALGVCREFGADRAIFERERIYTASAYGRWVERSFRCQ